ncbi:hypothetical protein [Spirosoma jeollabukense]
MHVVVHQRVFEAFTNLKLIVHTLLWCSPMKIITTLNWIIISLYGLSLLYLLATTNNPNNDAAGRGMISGFIILLLIFGAILIGLNLYNSQTTRIIALVIGGSPVVFMAIFLISEYRGSFQADKGAIVDTEQSAIQKPNP